MMPWISLPVNARDVRSSDAGPAAGWLLHSHTPSESQPGLSKLPTAFVASKDPLCTRAAINLSFKNTLNIYRPTSATDEYRNQSWCFTTSHFQRILFKHSSSALSWEIGSQSRDLSCALHYFLQSSALCQSPAERGPLHAITQPQGLPVLIPKPGF